MAKQKESWGLAVGLAIGVGVGVAVGAATDDLALWIALGLALGLVFGLSYDQQQKRKHRDAQVKVVDGATYAIVKRTNPLEGQRAHCWLGDNGLELELTDEEAERYGLD